MITKLLVANRGEIARRVFRTCRDLGVATVAVYSDADTEAPFVREADEAVPLGGQTPGESYLRADLVVAAALRVGADAVHPGYGFLSENADFARACADAGLTFVGPGVEAIELMGSKLTARSIMEDAGVPVLPGRDLTGVDDAKVCGLAEEVGWPILVKASFGGGGRGMRVVREEADLLEAIASARREAGSAFGNDTVFLEHYVDEPRHVEIQIFGDIHGTVVHLNERDCSIQRRHQKVVEESPSPAVTPELRETMGAAAVEAGRALGYVGAGTVEFLLAPDGRFFFLEVNTRLQVEHPVTEMVTGLDLVRLQLEVASGLPLPPEAQAPTITGHAVEVRLYAEDPAHEFLPAAGTLEEFTVPLGPGVRLDGGVETGDVVSTNYDPMLAKVIAHGATREEAVARLVRALRNARVHGVTTNRSLLVGILEHPDFAASRVDTHFFDRVPPETLLQDVPPDRAAAASLAAALSAQAGERAATRVLATIPSGFRTNPSDLQRRAYLHGATKVEVGYALGRAPVFEVDGDEIDVRVLSVSPVAADLVVAGVRRRYDVRLGARATYVDWPGGSLELKPVPRFPDPDDLAEPGSLLAPMPGTVVRVTVAAGDTVSAGQTVLVIEAMKMEHAITADTDGVVGDLPVTVGQAVDNGQVLIVIEETVGE
ncbi:ATP-grasp domain-containing protein [Nocardioides mangrovicus]|uniref:Biotin-dependent 3-methylcrotonyl-coenzyme A carboxylase alpha1 subunit n=1 Tax=Nocardioides mangrovicus TaxID=2478913 RepID=A0A3L8P7K4_9ACTN|nr:biotin carboxylase N-terminal domain-containing protein [Nocardioides mangrovicus]RLV50922.1 ATP-grasp domain-containing protein [Nocardioides mangrovicus]